MKERTCYFDNAKFILMVFVVFGHIIRTYINENELIYAIYSTIYTFHMPAFILVSGFFAKGFNKPGYIKKLTKKLILPYLIFQVVYTIYYYFLFERSTFQIEPFNPNWALWFLLSLFFWNLMLFIYTKFKPAAGLIIAVAIALGIGYVDSVSNFLSLSRTFVFFPFFLAGYHLNKDFFERLTSFKGRIIALVPFVIIFICFYFFITVDSQWMLGSKPYSEMEGTASVISMFKRLGMFGLNAVMIISFMALVPRGQYFFTRWGTQTLYVYLLHGFFVRTFRFTDLKEYFTTFESYLLLAGISLLLTIILSSQFVASIAQPFIELKWKNTMKMLLEWKFYAYFYKEKFTKTVND